MELKTTIIFPMRLFHMVIFLTYQSILLNLTISLIQQLRRIFMMMLTNLYLEHMLISNVDINFIWWISWAMNYLNILQIIHGNMLASLRLKWNNHPNLRNMVELKPLWNGCPNIHFLHGDSLIWIIG